MRSSLESHFYKNRFLYFSLSNSLSISHAHSTYPLSSSIFGKQKSKIEDDYIEYLGRI